jgi:PAS domain S-box-containing protein
MNMETDAALLNDILDTAADAIIVTDANQCITVFNASAQKTFGYSAVEVLGRNLSLLLPEISAAALTAHLRDSVANAEAARPMEGAATMMNGRRKDGSLFPIEASIARTTRAGQVEIIVNLRDMGESEQAQEVLLESEEQFRLLAENIGDYCVFMLDSDGHINSWNAGAERNTGYRSAEIIGKSFACFYPPEDIARGLPEQLLRTATVQGVANDLGWCIRRDGARFWAEVALFILREKDGRLRGFARVMHDATEHRRREEQLRQETMRAQLLAEISILLAACVQDYALLLDTISRRAAELIGDSCVINLLSDDGLWVHPEAVYYPDPEFLQVVRKVLASWSPRVGEAIVGRVAQTGVSMHIPVVTSNEICEMILPAYLPLLERIGFHSILVVPLRAQGRVIGTLGLYRHRSGQPYTSGDQEFVQELADRAALAITNARLLRQVQQQLTERQCAEADLLAYAGQLERSNRDLEDFAHIASHDLQEPLRKIQAFSDRLMASAGSRLGAEENDYLQRMHSAAARMQRMIEDLLAYSRVINKAGSFATVDLAQVVGEVLSDLEVRMTETGARVEVGPLPTLEADALQMYQLLQNLVGNALKYHREGVPPMVKIEARSAGTMMENVKGSAQKPADHPDAPPVEGDRLVSEQPSPGQIQIVVSDNGIGFDEVYLDRIFQPFQRLHGRSQYEGIGMGLAICRKIVECHGGSITARSIPGQGATFLVTLPLKQTVEVTAVG